MVALRLQIDGSIVRLASYHGDGFKEGVSITIYDELARWEKYCPLSAYAAIRLPMLTC